MPNVSLNTPGHTDTQREREKEQGLGDNIKTYWESSTTVGSAQVGKKEIESRKSISIYEA